jgi:hypothetical protein
MKKSKKEQKKARKEEKQVRSTVIEAFAGRNTENADKLQKANRKNKKIDNVLIQSLTQSVLLNKSMIKRDRNQTKNGKNLIISIYLLNSRPSLINITKDFRLRVINYLPE